ncbi:MAG: hypothetical protein KY445_07445 [Armatimonadetes bacterium]|nr:hypothetical protein [Armatimonadota bacterium]
MFRFLVPSLLLILTLPAHAQGFNFLDDEAEPGGYDVTAQITAPGAEFLLARSENGDGYSLKFTPQALQLWKIRAKLPSLLAQSPLKIAKFPANFVAQRRGPRWRFILNGQTALEAEDDAFSEGQIGTKGGVKGARVQPIEAIRFEDDFMRVAQEVALKEAIANPRAGVKIAGVQGEESIWSVAAGRFATTGLTENAEAQVAQSANPFAFRPMNAGENLSLAGRPFWSDYVASVSVAPQGASEIGLLVYAQDAKNYLGMFWSDKAGPQLRAVINGSARILDSAPNFGPFEAGQWNRLRLQIAGGQLRGFIDDAEVVRARTGLFGRGQIGLMAKLPVAGDDKKGVGAVFDDAEVRSIPDFYDDFSRVVPGRWNTIAGKWGWHGAARPADARGAYGVMGEANWTGYRVAANLRIPADGAGGLLLHHIAGKGAYLLRVSGSKAKTPGAGMAQIVLIRGNKTQVLGETAIKNRFDNSNLSWSFGGERGHLSAKVGDELIVDAFDNSLSGGRAGIYAQNGQKPVGISSFSVEWPQKTSNWAKVPALYEVDQQAQTMGAWSTQQGFWSANVPGAPATKDNAVWHKGEFFGDEDLRFALPDLGGSKTMKLLFAGKNGARLTLTLAGKDELSASLSDGKKNWEAKAPLKTGAPMEIARRGTFFIVRSGETVVLAARVG